METLKKYLFLFICFFSSIITTSNIPPLSFIQAMQPSQNFMPNCLNDTDWILVEQIYNKNFFCDDSWQQEPRIPKIIHHVWVGSPLPEKCRALIETWRKFHPNWQFILWTDQKIAEFNLQNKKQYDACDNFGGKSDIARYEILYRIGGLYADTDFECLQSFDELHHRLNFYTGIGYDTKVALFNGLIGSMPGHPILKLCIDSLSQTHIAKNDIHKVMEITGPYHFTRCFFKLLPTYSNEPIVAFPPAYFYPWPAQFRFDTTDARKWILPESYAIHYWHTSWQRG